VTATRVPGLTDSHTHLLTDAAGVPLPWQGSSVAAFHRRVAGAGTTPMDVLEPPAAGPPGELAARLRAGLARAASAGLVEITEMGMRHWWYAGALARLQHAGPLPGSSAFGASGARPAQFDCNSLYLYVYPFA
jgi:hypothetical protein